jgi:steroid 5-alpha reductase family enzyme
MNRTTVLLLVVLAALPWLIWRFDLPLTAVQSTLLQHAVLLMLAIAVLCFVLGELSGNVSQVDKLWSIVPPLYAWVLTIDAGYPPRMLLMALVATIWGIRLTYNFSRHGGYSWKFWSGAEDYRWAHVRKKPGMDKRLVWTAFHFGFICLYQNALLLAIALPILLAADTPRPLGVLDWLLAALFIGLVIFETVADQQQWRFQAEKKRRIKAGKKLDGDYARGFISSGLWARSRHPNYFAEQTLWVVFFLFSVAATGRLNWTIAGCLLLILLFQGSSNLSESVQQGKYPQYPDYRRRVPRFLPRIF